MHLLTEEMYIALRPRARARIGHLALASYFFLTPSPICFRACQLYLQHTVRTHPSHHNHHLPQAVSISRVSYSENPPDTHTGGLVLHTAAQSASFTHESVTRYPCPEHFKGSQIDEKQKPRLLTGPRGLRRLKSQLRIQDHFPRLSPPSPPAALPSSLSCNVAFAASPSSGPLHLPSTLTPPGTFFPQTGTQATTSTPSSLCLNITFRDFPGGTVVKNPPANAGDTGLSPDPGRSHMLWSY